MPDFSGNNSNNNMDYRTYSYAPPSDWPENQAWLTLDGLGGNDTIRGSIYYNWIDGGDGNDELFGNVGRDMLKGGNGVDILWAGSGNDTLYGGADNDTLYGESGDDRMMGDGGNDRLEGGAGNDSMFGGTGNDTVLGGTGDDILSGEEGADIMAGEAGNDQLLGGTGNDRYWFDGQGFDHVNDGIWNTGIARTHTVFDTDDAVVVNYTANDLRGERIGDSLRLYSFADAADSSLSSSLTIDDFYLGGHYVIESVYTSSGNGIKVDLTGLLPV